MNEILEQARGVLRSQPFSVLLGADVVAFSTDLVEIHLPITEKLISDPLRSIVNSSRRRIGEAA